MPENDFADIKPQLALNPVITPIYSFGGGVKPARSKAFGLLKNFLPRIIVSSRDGNSSLRHCEEHSDEAIQGVNKELFVGVETPTNVICHPELVSGSYKPEVLSTSQIAFTSLDWEVKHANN